MTYVVRGGVVGVVGLVGVIVVVDDNDGSIGDSNVVGWLLVMTGYTKCSILSN